ncbi:MAG: hypothetical protein IPM54_16750 [Polyangiaceae bacterium]|nr:hypothetical protein [Polyangiaceae bacterium]
MQPAAVLRAAGHQVHLVDALAVQGATLTLDDATHVRLGALLDDVIARIDADTDASSASIA